MNCVPKQCRITYIVSNNSYRLLVFKLIDRMQHRLKQCAFTLPPFPLMAPSVPKAVAKASKNVATPATEVKAAKAASERLTTPLFIARLAEESEVSLKETDVVAEEVSKTGETKILSLIHI